MQVSDAIGPYRGIYATVVDELKTEGADTVFIGELSVMQGFQVFYGTPDNIQIKFQATVDDYLSSMKVTA